MDQDKPQRLLKSFRAQIGSGHKEIASLRAQLAAAQKEIESLQVGAANIVIKNALEISDLRSENSALKTRCERMRLALESIASTCPIIEAADEDLLDDDPEKQAEVFWDSSKRRRLLAREALLADDGDQK